MTTALPALPPTPATANGSYYWFQQVLGAPLYVSTSLLGETDPCIDTLKAAGWSVIGAERPCEGTDQQKTEQPGLIGWAARMSVAGGSRNVMGEWGDKTIAICNQVVRQGWARRERIFLGGTSRGGFLAAHMAVRYPVRGLAMFCPVTTLDYSGLNEFAGIPSNVLDPYNIINFSSQLAYLAGGWNTISATDGRVGTANDVAFAATMPNMHFEIDAAQSGHGTSTGEYIAAANYLLGLA